MLKSCQKHTEYQVALEREKPKVQQLTEILANKQKVVADKKGVKEQVRFAVCPEQCTG